jgi:hypothetical protein
MKNTAQEISDIFAGIAKGRDYGVWINGSLVRQSSQELRVLCGYLGASSSSKVELMPQTRSLKVEEFPCSLQEMPKPGDVYYCMNLQEYFPFTKITWCGGPFDVWRFESCLIFSTAEEVIQAREQVLKALRR